MHLVWNFKFNKAIPMGVLPDKYEKYLQFFKFILKYRNMDIFADQELSDSEFYSAEKREWEHNPEELVKDLKKMGPTYIKLGQLLSTRSDLLPEPFLEALSALQDDVERISYEEVQEVFQEEIGDRISKAFASFDPEPIAAASIGQVHKAVLHSGKQVAVKIQRPGIRKKFLEDLDTLMNLSEKAEAYFKESRKYSIHETVEELRYILLQELNYTKEAENLVRLKENMEEFTLLFVPGIVEDYCSSRVLTMEFVEGQKVTSLSPFQLQELPREKMVDDFVKGYLKQIIVDGFAHADPHPGNIHVMKSGKLALMDLGMVARFDDSIKENILKLMIGLGENDGEEVTKVLLEMSHYDEREADVENFRRNVLRKVQENRDKKAEELQNGKTIMEINKIAAQMQIKLPIEFVSLGKILLNLDLIIAFLAPEYNFQKTIRNYVQNLMRKNMLQELKTGNVLRNILESKELLENLPHRLNKLTEDLSENKFRIKMDVFDEHRFILAFQKVANRITSGLIIASLILGAALIMRIPTAWTLWGYPGFAVILFVFAALIGFYLMYQILFKDEENRK